MWTYSSFLLEQMTGATAKAIVKEVKEAFNLQDKKREGEVDYEAAAKRFKVAVKVSLNPES